MVARNGPLYTLLAGGALGGALLVASVLATPSDPEESPVRAAEPTESPVVEEPETEVATPQPTPESEPTPEPTLEPEPTVPPTVSPEPVTYVGHVDDGAASVAVIVTGDEAIAYVCDGVAIEAWLSGSVNGGRLELSGEDGSLTGTVDDQAVSGETAADGLNQTFTIELVDPPQGLYRFADTIAGGAEVVGGWIVLPDGSQIGAVNVNGETRPAAELDLATGQAMVEGVVVTAERQG